jgi:hypothetical protein
MVVFLGFSSSFSSDSSSCCERIELARWVGTVKCKCRRKDRNNRKYEGSENTLCNKHNVLLIRGYNCK